MSKENSYIDAIFSETPRIMGVKLRQFSIGHYLLMKKYECNFVSDEPTQSTIDDLIMGISICAREYDEFLEFIQNEKCVKWFTYWGNQVNKDVKGNPFYIVDKKKQFVEYLNNGMKIPKYWLLVEEDGSRSSGKLIEHMINTLQGELGYSRTEVLNSPFNQVIFDYFLYLESKGIIELMNTEDLKLLEASNGRSI